MSASYITPGNVRAFQAVTSQMSGEVTLAGCRIDGEPGVPIVLMDPIGEGKVAVMPLFVAITATMDVAFEGEQRGDGDGGPRRAFPQRGGGNVPVSQNGMRQILIAPAWCDEVLARCGNSSTRVCRPFPAHGAEGWLCWSYARPCLDRTSSSA